MIRDGCAGLGYGPALRLAAGGCFVLAEAGAALAQEAPPPGAEPSTFLAGWWVLLAVALACLAFGGWVWWSYRGQK